MLAPVRAPAFKLRERRVLRRGQAAHVTSKRWLGDHLNDYRTTVVEVALNGGRPAA
jgi:hypothetical protein